MKILWIALVWPEPDSSAAGVRTTQLIDILLSAGHAVSVLSPCRDNTYRSMLAERGVATETYAPNDSSIVPFLQELDPEIVIFDRFMAEEQFGWRVREVCPAALRIVDTIDLHLLRRARERKIRTVTDSLSGGLCIKGVELMSDDAIREIASIYRSDISLLTSSEERRLLIEEFRIPESLIAHCPIGYVPQRGVPAFDGRKHFVTIGNFHHAPNADSYRVLRNEIWPRIRSALSDHSIELHVYGAYPTEEFLQYDDPRTGFRVMGRAVSAHETLSRYRVSLCPLRFGAGVKGKVADSWVVGTPVVGTSVAAEGMHDGLEFGGAVCDDTEGFVRHAVRLYGDETEWLGAQQCGWNILATRFTESRTASTFLGICREGVERCMEHRALNIVGQLLWHNQLRSTEYFSRWIEAKNRN